jgi:kynureninase
MPAYNFSNILANAAALDAADPLAHCRARFSLPAGVIYLDGNSLGALPHGVAQRLQRAVMQEWGEGLIRSWNDADWYPAPQRVGARIAALVGAKSHEVIACDSTTINLFKVLMAALVARPTRNTLICEEGNFPTDGYIGQSAALLKGKRVVWATQETVEAAIRDVGDDLAAVALTHVHYKTGRMADMARITALAHAHGGAMVWDLAHTAGVIPVQLHDWRVDYAVGCGYKYLNGGPGAPAYVYVREDLIAATEQPLVGWHGHAAPFAFEQQYRPHAGIDRMLVGTAPQLSLIALEEGLKAYDGVSMAAVRTKSEALTTLFIRLFDEVFGAAAGASTDAAAAERTTHAQERQSFGLATPREAAARGSQVSLTHASGYAIMQALIARGVIGDFRAPDILRFGFAPLYVTFTDVAHAIRHLHEVMESNEWREPRFAQRKAVT